MSSQSSTSENGRRATGSRPKMEHILSPSLSRMGGSLSPTPKIERSMSESFMLGDSYPQPQSPRTPERDDEPSSPPPKVEGFHPLSGLAHLSLVKHQRNLFCSELKTERIASAEAKASVAALRRLAFRLAINISVKENKIAIAAKRLASTRKNDYIASRNAEKKIEMLQESLQEEERRSKEILETLERASMLTIKYATPSSKTPKRLQPSPMTPPSSPPIRVSNPEYPQSAGLAGLWDHIGSPHTPDQSSAAYSRISDDRLDRAKHDAEQALMACRNRIESLQSECLRGRENVKLLEVTHDGDVEDYQARIAHLEKERSEAEETLRSIRSQLSDITESEARLRAEVELKSKAVSQLEKGNIDRLEEIDSLKKSKSQLEGKVRDRQATIHALEAHVSELEDEVTRLENRLSVANETEAGLLRQITTHDEHRVHLDAMAEKGKEEVGTLEKTVAVLEAQVKDYFEKLRSAEEEEALLRNGLKSSEALRKQAETELSAARSSLVEWQTKLNIAKDAIKSLQIDLERTKTSKSDLAQELTETEKKYRDEVDLREKTQLELDDLFASHTKLELGLEDAHARIASIEEQRLTVEDELERVKISKKALETQLKDTQLVSSGLRGDIGTHGEKITSLSLVITRLRGELAQSAKAQAEIQEELKQTKDLNDTLQSQCQHKQEELQSALDSTATLESSLREMRNSKEELEKVFQTAILRLKTSEKLNSTLRNDANQALHSKTEMQNSTQTMTDELAKSQSSNATLQKQLSDAQKNSNELDAQVRAAKDELATMESSIAALKTELKENQKAKAELEEELEEAHQIRSNAQERLNYVLRANADLTSEMQSQIKVHQDEVAALSASINDLKNTVNQSETSTAELHEQLSQMQKAKITAETRLEELKNTNANLTSEMQAQTKTHKEDVAVLSASITDLQNIIDQAGMSKAELQKQLSLMQNAKTEAETHLEDMKSSNANVLSTKEAEAEALREEIAQLRTVMTRVTDDLEASHISASDIHRELEDLRTSKALAEESVKKTTQLNDKLQSELQEVQAKLLKSESDYDILSTKLSEADKEIDGLQRTNAELESSANRVASAEQELDSVKHTNNRLTKFLQRVESDMTNTEAVVEDSEKHLDSLVEESNAKFNAAQESKKKYKHQLSVRGKQVALLKEENSRLRGKMEQQSEDIEDLKSREDRLRADLLSKDSEIAELRMSRAEFLASVRSIEEEVTSLRQDKEAFQDIVKTLQEKSKQLEILLDWNRPRLVPDTSDVFASAQSHVGKDGAQSSTTSTKSPKTTSVRSHASAHDRPPSRASTDSREDSLSAWAREVEKVRMLRDETAIQLKDMKVSKGELKKTLKASEAKLHQMEKKHPSPKRHRVLQKRQPATPNPTTSSSNPFASPQRPVTAGESPSTPHQPRKQGEEANPRPWSSLPRPQTSPQRPQSSFGRLVSHSSRRHSERRPSDVSDSGSTKSLRRFSTSVKKLFRHSEDKGQERAQNQRKSVGP